MTNILLVDDHPMALEGIKEILQEEPDFHVVAEATSGREAVEKVGELQPDVVLMDINLPDMDGKEATRIIKKSYPRTKIIMVTVSDDIVDLFESIKNGAQGYLIKNLEHDSWIPYIQSIIRDEAEIDNMFATKMLKEFSSAKHMGQAEEGKELSNREREIVMLVAQGLTNKEISIKLEISEYTVKNHLKSIFQKLHVQNRVQLANYAYSNGYMKEGH